MLLRNPERDIGTQYGVERLAVYPRGKQPGRYTYRPPLLLDDGWPAGTPST